MINILYNDLKTLISTSSLVPEEQYRITDYVTTVSKANYTSAGYKFDIVVTALTTNTLYEYATLLVNSTETYFNANDFFLYNIKYNVNNEIPGYSNDWVDANGKGCIYYMTDNKGNEAPYDFKNIKHNGKFLFNNIVDGSDTSLTISEYNSVKEVIEDGVFTIPKVIFNNGCHSVTIDKNASEVIITECSNLQIGDNCKNSEYSEVSNVVVGNDVIDSELSTINGGEIGDNNNGIIATNQTNLIIKDNNTTITLGGGNGVIVDSNNTNVTIGTNAKDIYINGSKTIDLGNNTEQFNISSSYNIKVEDDCKLFTLNETNHLTSTTGCNSITTISNDYVTLTESVTNVNISEGLNNLVLDGSKLVGNDVKTIIKQDEKVVVINEQTNSEVVLVEDGTTTSNPNSYITDSPADGSIYGRKDGNWEEIDIPDSITDAPLDNILYGRKDGSWKEIYSNGISIISITYNALKNLRDNGQLVSGQSYRIIDYTTTTSQANTSAAGNDFDIIVVALDENTLSENAGAVRRDDDTYFTNAKVESWEIKYCLDNDTSKFYWANTTNGKGVIYYMKDEWGNECPYDFKNIQFVRKLTNGKLDEVNGTSTYLYTFTWLDENNVAKDLALMGNDLVNDEGYKPGFFNNTIKETTTYFAYFENATHLFILNDNVFLSTWAYDGGLFYGCFNNSLGINCYSNTFGDEFCSNTFSYGCHHNKFGDYCTNNVFGFECYNNTFDNGCHSNKFGNSCYQNTFGNSCYFNVFGHRFTSNTFGNVCYNNVFGGDCQSNTFGAYCIFNIFGDNCRLNTLDDDGTSNTFGIGCSNNELGAESTSNIFNNYSSHNTFGAECRYNNFGNNCYSNTFSDECNSNIFGDNCSRNNFGDVCQSNVFGDYCYQNTFGVSCYSNTFGYYCYSNTFGDVCQSNSFGDECQSNNFYHGVSGTTPKNWLRYIVLENGIQNNNFYSDLTTSSGFYLQRIRIKGFGNTGTPLSTIITLSTASTDYNWVVAKDSSGVVQQYCPENLVDGSITDAPSDNNLYGRKNGNWEQLSAVFRYKGSVATYNALIALTGMAVGDVYNVNETGDNYAWTGSVWDKLAGEVDLSAYLTSANASNTYETITNVNILRNIVSVNVDDISDLQSNKADASDLVSVSDQVTANTEDIVALQSGKADKSTTLNGYGITDAYTKIESDDKYETIENVDTLRNIVNENTEDISNKADKSTTLAGYGIPDVPLDSKIYGRKDGNWSEINSGIADAPSDGLLYGRQDGDWEQIVDTGISDAPIDGTPYSRQDGDWVVAETGIEDAPNDGEVYGRKNSLWEVITTGGGVSVIPIFWSDLKALRDAGTLVPGQLYRIIDYVCTTTTTDSRAVNNLFDIIVIALDASHLSENASATYHEADTYFSSNNANLESWELKYCLDNDTSRFDWANSNGKGVIYYMKDNYNNELPYDFKNIQYLKNSVWVYTFGGATDDSLGVTCYNNIINPYISSNKQTLNNITFGNGCRSNTFGYNCRSNTFGDSCVLNTFGFNCWSNTFGDRCESNTFIWTCYSNTFGDWCSYNRFSSGGNKNTFGFGCYSSTFGRDFTSNTFGRGCTSNTFGDFCYYNTFGEYCQINTFGDRCRNNTFGNYFYSNTFGDECSYNNFYHGSSGTIKKNYIRYIVLEDGVSYNNFYSNAATNADDYLQRIRIKGLSGTSTTPLVTQITLTATNTNQEWVVAKNSSGIIKQYCPENLVDAGGITDAPSNNKIYGRKNSVWSEINIGTDTTIKILRSELLNLRNNNLLVPGQKYRIIDYMCSTNVSNTRSAGNQFDIIVTALDKNKLSENASAIKPDGLSYFNVAKLEAWELKYCIDNDINRFAWNHPSNGTGVIYYMKDEWGNECPYDFKNIQYRKNNVWVYTFGGEVDDSLTGGECYNNKINPYVLRYYSTNKQTLNEIIFGYNCHSNTFGNNCHHGGFGDDCSYNTIGNDSSASFGNNCSYNIIGNNCSSNTFGNYYYYNTVGNDCNINVFYTGTTGATIKDYLRYIVLEDGCRNNNFYSDVTTSSTSYLQRIRIRGISHPTNTKTQITLPATNTDYNWIVARNSSGGTIRQYCLEALLP